MDVQVACKRSQVLCGWCGSCHSPHPTLITGSITSTCVNEAPHGIRRHSTTKQCATARADTALAPFVQLLHRSLSGVGATGCRVKASSPRDGLSGRAPDYERCKSAAGIRRTELVGKSTFGYFWCSFKSDSYSQGLASKKAMDGAPTQAHTIQSKPQTRKKPSAPAPYLNLAIISLIPGIVSI